MANNRRSPDLFDRLFHSRPLRWAEPFFGRHREILLYLLFGGITTAVSIGTFVLLRAVLLLNEHIANTVSWIAAVLVAFLTNRRWVFRDSESRGFWTQLISFYGSRVVSFLIEEAVILVGITWLAFPDGWVKLAAQCVVLILNYLLSKWLVFRKK